MSPTRPLSRPSSGHGEITEALYHAFINATTVGYGDSPPTERPSKSLAILLAFIGLVFTGIVVAIAIHAADYAFGMVHEIGGFLDRIRR